MQPRGLVGCIECGGSHHPSSHVRANPLSQTFSQQQDLLWQCATNVALMSERVASSAMDTTRGIGTLLEFLCPTYIM